MYSVIISSFHNLCLSTCGGSNISGFSATDTPSIIQILRKKYRRCRIDTEVRCVGADPPFGSLSRRALNPIKPVYDPDRPDGRLNLTASAFNQLGQYTSSPGRRSTAMQNLPFFSLAVAVTIASTHCAYPQKDGQLA